MAIRTADAEWRGNLPQGSGETRLGSGAFEGPHDFRPRLANRKGADPDKLFDAAYAGRFSMALALQLTNSSVTAKSLHATAKVDFEERDGGWTIHTIDLETKASISEITAAVFEKHAQNAKKKLPDLVNLSGVDTHLRATLS